MSKTLIRTDGTKLAYDQDTATAAPGLLCLHGFQSERTATKVAHLRNICADIHAPFAALDFFAHGDSEGAWDDFTIGHAVDDATRALDELTSGPQILMGSSMGGWVALKLMLARPQRVAGLVLVAPAPDFTTWIERDYTPSEAAAEGFTPTFVAEGRTQTVMDQDWPTQPLVHILQGKADTEVPWQTAEAIKAKFKNPNDVKLTFVDDGDHRLNREPDLELLKQAFLGLHAQLSA